MRPVSDAQVRKLMEEMSKHGQIGQAAMKAGHGPEDGAQVRRGGGKLPSEMSSRGRGGRGRIRSRRTGRRWRRCWRRRRSSRRRRCSSC